jgi:UBX domain-containing protein 1
MSAPASPAEHEPTQPRFTGTGYTLGSESQPSQPVVQAGQQQRGQRPPTRRVLTLWHNGFTIDDGPLYPFTDPESLEILREIRMGRLPRNIANVENDEEIEMAVQKRENEDWTPSASRATSRVGGGGGGSTFHGQGNRLGR